MEQEGKLRDDRRGGQPCFVAMTDGAANDFLFVTGGAVNDICKQDKPRC